MKHSCAAMSIRLEFSRSTSTARAAAQAQKARYAEELAEVDSAVSRAALLLRRSVKRAA